MACPRFFIHTPYFQHSAVLRTLPSDEPSLFDAQWLSGYLQPLNPVTMQGTIGDGLYAEQDVDLYRIELGAEQSISVDIDANVSDDGLHLSDLDSLIRVFDSLGRDVTSSAGVVRSGDAAAPGDFVDPDNPAEYLDDYLSWTAAEAGVYFIGISSYPNGQYSPLSDPIASGSGSVSQPRAGEVGDYEVEFILGEPAPPVIAIGDVHIARNQTRADFEMALSYPATKPVTVQYMIASDTATAGQDFTAGLSPLTGTITFQPGESLQTISVAIPAGQRSDDTRGFSITLTDPVNGELDPASTSATGHIIGNNDHSLDAAAIDFNALGVPSVTLAGGYHVDSHTPLSDDWIDALLASGNSNTGTFTGDRDGDWSYVQSFDATSSQPAGDGPEDDGTDPGLLESMIAALGPATESGLDDSLTFTFTAAGGTLGSSFTLAVTGGRNNEDEDGNYDRQNLTYTLTVDTDAGGNIVNTSVTGTATSSSCT